MLCYSNLLKTEQKNNQVNLFVNLNYFLSFEEEHTINNLKTLFNIWSDLYIINVSDSIWAYNTCIIGQEVPCRMCPSPCIIMVALDNVC